MSGDVDRFYRCLATSIKMCTLMVVKSNFSDQNHLTTFTKDPVLLHLFGPAGVNIYTYWYLCIYTYTFLYVYVNWFLNDGNTCFFSQIPMADIADVYSPIFARSNPCFCKVTDHEARTYLLLTRWPTNLMCEQDAVKDSPLKDDCNPYLKERHLYCWGPTIFVLVDMKNLHDVYHAPPHGR